MSDGPSVMLVCERLDLAGGVERFACSLANHLAQQGMKVSLASAATRREQLQYDVLPQVRVLHGTVGGDAVLPASAWARRWALARKQWRVGRSLSQLARREQPDVVILNGLTTACSLLGFAPGLAPRAVCCDHNHFEARSRPWRWLRRWLYARAGAVVSLTEADRVRFAAINPRTVVIPNASTLQAEEPALVSSPEVLAVGRHVAQKGFDLLLLAWEQVLHAVPEARLTIVGEGPLQPALLRQAQDLGLAHSIAWCLPTRQIEAYYRRAAVFALPSRYEGMPLALLEAQALGLPAVAFDCPTGPRDIVGDDTGMLVAPEDTVALAGALVSLLTQPALRERMARAAIVRSRALFSPQQTWNRWTALVRQVASAREGVR